MHSVLIVGAGPTGLVLALYLTKQGVPVRIIDKAAGPGTASRALAVHARTLELYNQVDLAEAVVARGYTVPGTRLWVKGEQAARIPFEQIVSDLTPYGFLHVFPQDEHERLLTERLESLGVVVERSTELVGCTIEGDGAQARIRKSDGTETVVEAQYIAGCDGARSTVREQLGVGFPGGTYSQLFYVADVSGEGPAFNGDLNVDLDDSDFLAIFPLADRGRIRLIGAVKPRDGERVDALTFDDISPRAIEKLRLKIDEVNWFSTYHVHHRVTEKFRMGRAFLLGDAAHIHTPAGGQGMNTGIGDAINLAWKLRAVIEERATDALLDSYEAERRAFALRLVGTTDRAFNFVASDGHLAELARTRIAPILLPALAKFDFVREYMFRTISQITLNYRGKGLDSGQAGPLHGGDRLPWTRLADGDNYRAFKQIGWQVHVYGAAGEELKAWCEARRVPLHEFDWSDAMEPAGLRRNALYLIRPDTYIGLAHATQATDALEKYLDETQIDV